MSNPLDQTAYWNSVADAKVFAHPLDAAGLAKLVPPGSRILDSGCGYGRTTAELAAHGWRAIGVDPAERMLRRGRAAHPGLPLVCAAAGTIPVKDASFDAAVLFAVLTCVPEDAAQRALVAEIRRVLRPRGVLYVSDLLLNDDARNVARYQAARGRGLPYGTFELPEGVVLRHHDRRWIETLFATWTDVGFREFTVETMNGHTSHAFQLFVRR